MKHAIPDVATARRCIDALAEYLATKDDSPRAAADLRESVRLLSAQPQWQPIETAPKDGSEFWAHCVSGMGAPRFNQEVARWVEAPKGYTFGGRFATRSGAIPIMWHPLPVPPSLPSSAQKDHS